LAHLTGEYYVLVTFFLPLQPHWPIQPLIQCVLWVKWLGLEADHSSLSSAKVKSAWSYTLVWCLIKHRMSSWHGTWLSKGTTLAFMI